MDTRRVYDTFWKELILNFHELGLGKTILRTLEEIGHTEPTPIQTQAIPVVLEGKDIVGLAQTGTGKTAAFLLPLLENADNPKFRAKFRPIRILILSPTRELAAQIFEKAREYGKSLNLKSQCTVGGVPIGKQANILSRGTDILIATPGRLLDLAKRNALRLDQVEALVLDEADHMLDIGFLPDVKRIIAQLPKERQTLLFSATMPKAIAELADNYLTDPVEVSIARQSSVAENIDQSVIHLPQRTKTSRLGDLINQYDEKRIVVFSRTKHGSDKIVKWLATQDIDARAIHGNKTQGQRERALKAFTRGDCKVLIATDIAARGIDIKDVGLVVNYDLPDVPEVYVHRIGRTARAGASGLSIAFCAPDEIKKLRAIEKLIKMKISAEGDVVEPASDAPKKPHRGKSRNRPGSNARRRDNDRKSKDGEKSEKNNRPSRSGKPHRDDEQGDRRNSFTGGKPKRNRKPQDGDQPQGDFKRPRRLRHDDAGDTGSEREDRPNRNFKPDGKSKGDFKRPRKPRRDGPREAGSGNEGRSNRNAKPGDNSSQRNRKPKSGNSGGGERRGGEQSRPNRRPRNKKPQTS